MFYDGDCGFCERSVRMVQALDWLGCFRYATLQSEEARVAGIPPERNPSEMVLGKRSDRATRLWGGWRAVKQIAFRTPVFYFGLALTLLVHPVVTGLLLVALSPLGNPLGERCYRFVARNRHRIAGSACTLDRR